MKDISRFQQQVLAEAEAIVRKATDQWSPRYTPEENSAMWASAPNRRSYKEEPAWILFASGLLVGLSTTLLVLCLGI